MLMKISKRFEYKDTEHTGWQNLWNAENLCVELMLTISKY